MIIASQIIRITPALGASELSYEDVVSLIKSKDIKSIDHLLAELPADYRSSYTFMHTSQSLQYADYKDPRVILYGRDAKLIMTFTSEIEDLRSTPKNKIVGTGDVQGAFDKIEVMQFRTDERRFDFYEISFPENNPTASTRFSQKNPAKCMSCHQGPDPKPIWEHYNLWNNAFFGDDDQYDKSTFDTYIVGLKTRKRYQRLEKIDENYGEEHICGACSTQERTKINSNSDLHGYLSYWNARRIVRQMESHPLFDKLLYTILGFLSGDFSDSSEPFLDESSKAHGFLRSYEQNLKLSLEKADTDADEETQKIFMIANRSGQRLWGKPIAFFDSLGMDTTTWFLNRAPGAHNGLTIFGYVQGTFVSALKESRPQISPYVQDERVGYDVEHLLSVKGGMLTKHDEVAVLSKQEIKALEANNEKIMTTSDGAFLKLLNRTPAQRLKQCMSCHDGDHENIPYIAFESPKSLSKATLEQISKRISARRNSQMRMPPLGPYMSREQQQDFMLLLSNEAGSEEQKLGKTVEM